ncbi:MAG: glutathione-disulfide reductase [Pseudomonadales bacterium]
MTYDYDLFVIGAGSGGVRASRISAGYGARVAVAEDRYLGGTCVNVGCVPKKLFVYGSHFSEEFEDASAYGWDVSTQGVDWPRLRDNKTREIERLNGIYANLLDNAGVERIWGTARLADAHTVVVGDKTCTAEHILIATGGWPVTPDFPGSEHSISSNEMFYLDRLPERALILGGGYIAVEFAGILQGLGVKTQLLYRGELFLRGFDDGVRRFVKEEVEHKGIELRFNDNIERIDLDGMERVVRLESGAEIRTDLVLSAIGRAPKTAGLGLEAAGVELSASGAIRVDEYYRTSVPNILAIGDVTDRLQLTPVAIAEGMCIANNLFTDRPKRSVDYENVATAVFCQPNIGTVGLTEEQARQRYPELQVFESTFRPMKHTLTGRPERTLMKLLVNGADDRVVGAHMVGAEAGEIIQGIAVAIKACATKADFDATIGIHPTAAEEFVTMRTPRAAS